MKGKNVLQKWQIDFENFFNVYSAFLIDGYIDDYQPYVSDFEKELEIPEESEFKYCKKCKECYCAKYQWFERYRSGSGVRYCCGKGRKDSGSYCRGNGRTESRNAYIFRNLSDCCTPGR